MLLRKMAAIVIGCSCLAAPAMSGEAFVDRFQDAPEWSGWRLSDYANRAGWLHTRWDPDQIVWSPGALRLALEPEGREVKPFVSGELRRKKRTHYGRYEVVMRAARGKGLNTAFFTYTGPHRDDPHDEVDIEIIGKDTTKISLSYFVDGVSNGQGAFDLGFDAANAAHHYAFEWTAEGIAWYANGRMIHKTGPADPPPPQTPSQVYLSLWIGSPQWLGAAQPNTSADAEFTCVAYSPDLAAPRLCPAP